MQKYRTTREKCILLPEGAKAKQFPDKILDTKVLLFDPDSIRGYFDSHRKLRYAPLRVLRTVFGWPVPAKDPITGELLLVKRRNIVYSPLFERITKVDMDKIIDRDRKDVTVDRLNWTMIPLGFLGELRYNLGSVPLGIFRETWYLLRGITQRTVLAEFLDIKNDIKKHKFLIPSIKTIVAATLNTILFSFVPVAVFFKILRSQYPVKYFLSRYKLKKILSKLREDQKYYIKPSNGAAGKGVVRFSLQGNTLMAENVGENNTPQTKTYSGETAYSSFKQFVSQYWLGLRADHFAEGNFLIEKEIPSMTLDGRKFEVRTLVTFKYDKEGGAVPHYEGCYVKLGSNGVVANISKGGEGITLSELIHRLNAQVELEDPEFLDNFIKVLERVLAFKTKSIAESMVGMRYVLPMVSVDYILSNNSRTNPLDCVVLEINTGSIGLSGLLASNPELYDTVIQSYVESVSQLVAYRTNGMNSPNK